MKLPRKMPKRIEDNAVKFVSLRRRKNAPLKKRPVRRMLSFLPVDLLKACSLASRVLHRPQAQLPVLTDENPILTKERAIGTSHRSLIPMKKNEPDSFTLLMPGSLTEASLSGAPKGR